MSRVTFQSLILKLQNFWAERGCILETPLDLEVGAGTMHPATYLRVLGPEPWNVVMCSPPASADGRYGDNPFASQALSVSGDPQAVAAGGADLYLDSLRAIGLDLTKPTSASKRTTGSRPRSGLGVAGRFSSTAWRSRSSPTSQRRRHRPHADLGEITTGWSV